MKGTSHFFSSLLSLWRALSPLACVRAEEEEEQQLTITLLRQLAPMMEVEEEEEEGEGPLSCPRNA